MVLVDMIDKSFLLVITVVALGVFFFECYKRAEKDWETTKTIGNRIKIIGLCGGLFGLSLIVCVGGLKALIGFFILVFGTLFLGLQQWLLDRLMNNKKINETMRKGICIVLFVLAFAIYCLGLYVLSSIFPVDISELANLP